MNGLIGTETRKASVSQKEGLEIEELGQIYNSKDSEMELTRFVVVHDFNEYLEMVRDCNQSIIEKLFSSDKVLYLKYFSISPQKREFESNRVK